MDVINVISLILTIMVIAMFGYQFFYILVSLIDEIKTRIQKNNQTFLTVLPRPKISSRKTASPTDLVL